MTEGNRNTKLKITIDVLSGMAIFLMLVVFPIWIHYDEESYGTNGKMPMQIKLILVNAIPFIFGFLWLIFRYSEIMNKKYPFIRTRPFKVLIIFGPISIYIIVKAFIWR